MVHVEVPRLTKKYLLPIARVMTITLMSMGLTTSNALAISSEPPIVDHVTIHHGGDGFAASYALPIYQVEDIRFLSAGVGIEERKATYPSFPLKLIFAESGGAFLTGVSVTIQDMSGKEILTISPDQISGPWLFLDLGPGTYRVTAIRGDGTPIKQTIHLAKGKTKSIYFHWPTPKAKG